jgi:hypothetical protein
VSVSFFPYGGLADPPNPKVSRPLISSCSQRPVVRSSRWMAISQVYSPALRGVGVRVRSFIHATLWSGSVSVTPTPGVNHSLSADVPDQIQWKVTLHLEISSLVNSSKRYGTNVGVGAGGSFIAEEANEIPAPSERSSLQRPLEQ